MTDNTKYFTIGCEQINNDTETVFAKQRNNRYYVKRATYGPEAGKLANPFGTLYKVGQSKTHENRTGKQQYEYSEVTKTVFDMYLKFLETHSEIYLRNAEREMM
jgi:hypothetical protein